MPESVAPFGSSNDFSGGPSPTLPKSGLGAEWEARGSDPAQMAGGETVTLIFLQTQVSG